MKLYINYIYVYIYNLKWKTGVEQFAVSYKQ